MIIWPITIETHYQKIDGGMWFVSFFRFSGATSEQLSDRFTRFEGLSKKKLSGTPLIPFLLAGLRNHGRKGYLGLHDVMLHDVTPCSLQFVNFSTFIDNSHQLFAVASKVSQNAI